MFTHPLHKCERRELEVDEGSTTEATASCGIWQSAGSLLRAHRCRQQRQAAACRRGRRGAPARHPREDVPTQRRSTILLKSCADGLAQHRVACREISSPHEITSSQQSYYRDNRDNAETDLHKLTLYSPHLGLPCLGFCKSTDKPVFTKEFLHLSDGEFVTTRRPRAYPISPRRTMHRAGDLQD